MEYGSGVVCPHLPELILRKPAHPGEVGECLTAGRGGNLHFNQRLRQRRAAHLCLDAHGGQRRGKAQNLCFREPHLLSGTCQTQGHFHNRRFGGGVVVAQIHQRGAEVLKQRLIHTHDVGKLGQCGTCVLCHDIRAVAKVDHDAGEVFQRICLYAQLPGNCHDL